MMEKFYRDCLKERLGAELHVSEAGYIAYTLHPEAIYIVEFFIDKEFRHSGKEIEKLMHVVRLEAQINRKNSITSRVQLHCDNKEKVLGVFLKYGFKLTGMDTLPAFTLHLPLDEVGRGDS